MKFSAKDYNFFDKFNKSRTKAQKKAEFLAVCAALVLFVCFCGVGVGYLIWQKMQVIQDEIDTYTKYLESSVTVNRLAKNAELNERLSALTTYGAAAERLNKRLEGSAVINTYLLQSISNSIPADCSILTMAVSSDSIEIMGKSGSETSIGQFERNLIGLRYIDSVHVSDITKDAEGCKFAMSIEMKEVASIESIGNE